VARHRPYALLLAPHDSILPCLGRPVAESPTPSFGCAGPVPSALSREAARLAPAIRIALAGDTSLALLRAAALLDLVFGSGDTEALNRASLRFGEAVARDSANPALLRDAATAHALLGSIRQDAGLVLQALDLIERAWLLDSAEAGIRLNRDLLLGQLGLSAEAIAESDSLPESLRGQAIDVALPEWGERIESGDTKGAGQHLAEAIRAGRTLDAGEDSSVSAAARLIQDAQAGAAAGLAAYGRGRRHFDAGNFERAAPDLRRAFAAFVGPYSEWPPAETVALWGWPAVYLGAYWVYEHQYARADSLFARVLLAAGGRPLLALRGRASWGRALSLARQDRPDASLTFYGTAIDLFTRAGELTSVGAMESQSAAMHLVMGDLSRAASAQVRALRAYRQRRDLGTLQGVLQSFAAFELRSGRPHSALAMLRKAVQVSVHTGRIKDVPEALARLASAEIGMGRPQDARRHLAAARASLPGIASPMMQAGVATEIDRVEARLASDSAAIGLFSRVATYYERQRIPYSLAPTLVERAGARVRTGDTAGAELDLDRALAVIRRRASRLNALSAAAAREVTREVFERRVVLHLARGDSVGALAEIDGQRTWSGGPSRAIAKQARRLDPDHAIIAYAALPDRLLVWVIAREGVTTVSVPIGARRLAELAGRLDRNIRHGGDSSAVLETSRALHRLIITPVRDRLREKARVTVIADPVLSTVPFAVLNDPDADRYLVQDHTLAFAFGLREVLARSANRSPRPSRVLLVGNPALDRAQRPELAPLRHAGAEIDSLASMYPGAAIFSGRSATRPAVLAGLGRTELLHFSGHALSANQSLAGSRLILAPGNPTDDGSLDGREIAGLRLSGVRLAILSACETLRGEQTGSYRPDGLAEAFLAAGAGGVIGSLWAVDDAGTTRLMIRLHRALRSGLAPARALQTAQLGALRETAGRTLDLRTWAAFRYLTR
jgi:CHAT domain-containing protein/tetratricopeptide (TPR) repeat protein